MAKRKIVTLCLKLDFEVKNNCIFWVGGETEFEDDKGNSLDITDYPNAEYLLIQYLAKMREGKNEGDELAIVNRFEDTK